MKSPEFSIIVPVYMAEKTIHKCIESILTQTVTDFELILVNDGSTDRSGEICEELSKHDSRIKVLHKENGGVSEARNVALDNAVGERICFVDSDDIIDNCFLEIFKQKDADIVVQGMFRNDIKDGFCTKEQYVEIEEGDFDLNCRDKFIEIICKADNIGYLVTRAFKREIIEKNSLRLNTTYKLREDQEFILRYMVECKTFATVNKGAYHYDVPTNFVQKYSHIDPESNILCTLSIIENFEKTKKMSNRMLAENLNSLSESILNLYKSHRIDTKKINSYMKYFCKYYKRCKKENILSKKSLFLYYAIGTHTPQFMHNVYSKILKMFN